MRARVIEMDTQKGLGKALLASGETLPFDVAVSVLGVPVVGAELEVDIGPSRLGGLKVTRVEIIPSWESTTTPCLYLRECDGNSEELLYMDGRQAFRATIAIPKPLPPDERPRVGTSGQLVLERKRGAENFFEKRVVGWSIGEIDAASRLRLLAAYRDLLADAWETWEDADSLHTSEQLRRLKTDLFVGLDLGLDVDELLTITDYPIDPPQSHHVHDMRAFGPLPASIDRKVRLTRAR
jgi:hypothetical protein